MNNKKQSQSKKIERNNKLKSATNSFKTVATIMLVLSCIIDFIAFVISPVMGLIGFIPTIIGFILMNIMCEYLYSISNIEDNSNKQIELLEKILLENIKNNEK